MRLQLAQNTWISARDLMRLVAFLERNVSWLIVRVPGAVITCKAAPTITDEQMANNKKGPRLSTDGGSLMP